MSSELDLELIETLLDGELPPDQANALRARIASDAELSAALARVRGARELRALVWRASEPREAKVQTLLAAVRRGVRQDEIGHKRLRALRYVSGLAACIVVGFLMGRFVPYGTPGQRDNGIVFQTPQGPVMEVSDGASASVRAGAFKVLLTDAYGRVIAEQRFDTLNEAREFTEDLSRAQNRYRAPQQPQPQPQPQQLQPRANDTFFIRGEF